MVNRRNGLLIIILAILPALRATATPVIGQVDDFEDGTTQGWQINLLGLGSPPAGALPVNIASGGPTGADDNFLRLTSLGGSGSGSRLSVINTAQWKGNYLAAGVGAIEMNLNNLGQSDVFLRLMLADPTVGPPSNIAFSSNAIFIPGGSGWAQRTFSLSPVDLTAGLGSIAAALSNATELRLYHSPNASFPNPTTPIAAISAVVGVDNIRAVPEPATLAPVALWIAGGLLRRLSTSS